MILRRRAIHQIKCLPAVVLVAGCAELGLPEWSALEPFGPSQSTTTDGPIPVSGARTADQLDTATAAERAQAASPSNVGGRLGTTVATLGTATEPGFWLKTPLVQNEQKGVVRSRDSGKRVTVTLIPIDGPPTAGSRISLSAMRSLDLPLTALAELDVSRAG